MSSPIPEFGPLVWNDSAEMLRQSRARAIANAVMHVVAPYLREDSYRRCGDALYDCALAGGLVLVTEKSIQELEDRVRHIEGNLVL